MSWEADAKCLEVYTSSRTNDESDACRHFIWAGLLYERFGQDFSEEVLDAHEEEPLQSEAEKAMDLANNRRGLSAAERLKKGTRSADSLLAAFKEELKNGNLIVLEPRPKPKE